MVDNEPPFALVDPDLARAAAICLFEKIETELRGRLPRRADIRHIGATAVPGCLTKGDLDIVVRVPTADFEAADAALAAHFGRNTGSIRTESFSAFEDGLLDPHLGIQLTTIGGAHDYFHLFVDALLASPALVTKYNALKQQFDGVEMAAYRRAKDAFVERVIWSG